MNDYYLPQSYESEERTPGRLQAVWPPPKPKDKEEKIGLKYTEAGKSACTKKQMQMFALSHIFALHVMTAIAELKEKAKRSHGDLCDVAVSTEDNVTPRAFRTVCIQTDRETFIKPVEDAELSSGLCPQPVVPKKLDLTSINLSLSGKQPEAKQGLPPLALPLPPPPPPLPVQSESETNRAPPPPPSLSGHCDSNDFSKPDKSLDRHLPLEKGSGPPPPLPPPPMAGYGLPPPPPPIPGSAPSLPTGTSLLLSKGEEWPQRKPRVEPVCPMKPLYWTRIHVQNNRNDTLWSSLKEPAIINTNEFAELFAKMSSPAKRKPLSEAYEKKGKAKKIIKLLDGKRSQAVGILISSLHLDMKDIQQAVLMLDNSVVDLDAIEALYENRAQPEELERIRKHYETSDEEQVKLLDKPEQFLYELSRIPEFSLRACCIILQSTFADAIASIRRKTEIVLHVCKDLLEQDSVKEVMGLVLALGNYMNGGSRTRGQADGFGLDILPKLKDVKSRDNHTSLLDYVVSYYLRNLDENAGTENCIFPLPEPQDVFLAAQVKFEDLSKELRKLGKDLADEPCSLWTVVLPFSPSLLTPLLSFRDLVEYFGLKPRSGEQDVLPGHVFMLWFEFCTDFKTRWKRENKAISKER
uniref:Formin 1 n=1 Tax=Pygocentrus nattereri TaxID=42514 RepID=A0A3B4EEP6_PYGNA